MSEQPDVLVVGAGAIGVACAYYLAKSGRHVVVLDELATAGAACSLGNAGLVSPSHCIPLARPGATSQLVRWMLNSDGAVAIRPRLSAALARFGWRFVRSSNEASMLRGLRVLRDTTRASKQLFDGLVGDAGLSFGYRDEGLMNVCFSKQAMDALRADAELLAEEGFEPVVHDADGARDQEPALGGEISGGVFWAEDAFCDPGEFVSALAAAGQRAGAEYAFGERITTLECSNGRVGEVVTSKRRLRPHELVLAAGAWSAELARPLGLRLPLEAGTGYNLEVGGVAGPPRIPLIFQELVFAATPLSGRVRLAGTMEFAGLRAATRPERADRLLDAASDYLPSLKTARGVRTRWSGYRPVTPDTLPVVGRSSRFDNLVWATGHAMLGITLAPYTGQAIAALLAEGDFGAIPDDLAPGRFGV